MSTIKLEIEVSAENVKHVSAFLEQIAGGSKAVAQVEVVDAEEVKVPKTPTPRPSRAKVKQPEPEEEEIEEEDELNDAPEEEESEEIDADDIRALQATKVDAHRATIRAELAKLGATGIKDLDAKNYQKYYDFLAKLK
jgi:hypothetical protein